MKVQITHAANKETTEKTIKPVGHTVPVHTIAVVKTGITGNDKKSPTNLLGSSFSFVESTPGY